jgi:hypothetical protein
MVLGPQGSFFYIKKAVYYYCMICGYSLLRPGGEAWPIAGLWGGATRVASTDCAKAFALLDSATTEWPIALRAVVCPVDFLWSVLFLVHDAPFFCQRTCKQR